MTRRRGEEMKLRERFNTKEMMSCLVIDNDRKEQFRFALLLRKIGFKIVLCAATGKRGIKLARKFKPDLILVDLLLPDMDGDEVSRAIKEMVKAKIIILSDFRHGHYVEMPYADLFATKTADVFSFYRTIKRLQWGRG